MAAFRLDDVRRSGPASSANLIEQGIELLADNGRITREEYEVLKKKVDELGAEGLLSRDAQAKWDKFSAAIEARLGQPPSDPYLPDGAISGDEMQFLLQDVRNTFAESIWTEIGPFLNIKG